MIVSITKIKLNSYLKVFAFMRFNSRIITQLQNSKAKKYKVKGSWNLKTWYTMSLWETEEDLIQFYRNGAHLEAMKNARYFSNDIDSTRVESNDLIGWSEGIKILNLK